MDTNNSSVSAISNNVVATNTEEDEEKVEVKEEGSVTTSFSNMEEGDNEAYTPMSILEYYVRHHGSNVLYKTCSNEEESTEGNTTDTNQRSEVDDFKEYRDTSASNDLKNPKGLTTFINYEYGGRILYNGISTVVITLAERRTPFRNSRYSNLDINDHFRNDQDRIPRSVNEIGCGTSSLISDSISNRHLNKKPHNEDSTTQGESNHIMNLNQHLNNNNYNNNAIHSQNNTNIQSRTDVTTNNNHNINRNQIHYTRRRIFPEVIPLWNFVISTSLYIFIMGLFALFFYLLLFYKKL